MKIKLNSRALRIFVTLDQLAAQMKTCRSAIEAAFKRYKAENPALVFDTRKVRTDKRGPLATAYRIAR